MSSVRAISSGILSIALIVVMANGTSAATSTSTISVSVTVPTSCNVTGGSLAFGSYDVLSATPTDASMIFTATCATGTTAAIGLGLGSHASGSTRRMTDADGDLLPYELYKDSGHTTIWGQSGSDAVSYLSASSAPSNFTIYGRIPAQENVDTATYSDSITVTITF